MKTYFILVKCKWVKVTASLAKFLSLPHVVLKAGCVAGPLVLAGLAAAPFIVSPPLPEAIIIPTPHDAPFSPSTDYVPDLSYIPGAAADITPPFTAGGYMPPSALLPPVSHPYVTPPVYELPAEEIPTDVPEPSSIIIFGTAVILAGGLWKKWK